MSDLLSTGLRWLVLDLNSFFASCEQQERPELRGQPVAVVPLLAETTCAIAASYPAKAYGIKTGTPVHEARRLCPELRVVPARPKLYVTYHQRILQAIESCIPVEEVMSIDEVACRLDRVQQEPEQARQLARRIKGAIRAQVGICLTSSIGIAANKLLAKLASDMQKPDGLTLLLPAAMPAPILHLPVEALSGIGHQMGLRLRQAGITDMAALWAADSGRLRAIWGGVTGVRYHALLHGADFPSPARQRGSISHQHVLPPAQRTLHAATPILRQLLTRAAERLRREGFSCRKLVLDIKWTQQGGHWGVERRCAATQDTGILLRVLMDMLAHAPLRYPLRVGVALVELTPAVTQQPDLFTRRPSAALMGAIDRMNLKYGRGTVHYGLAARETRHMTSKIAFQRVPDRLEL
ncbi:MAG: DNA polymerase [Alphaproteobacteria bacterium]